MHDVSEPTRRAILAAQGLDPDDDDIEIITSDAGRAGFDREVVAVVSSVELQAPTPAQALEARMRDLMRGWRK